ncbi:unnamed protein product [Mytilus coruscus]|uniref:Uncharacterized protein n=1 Tax=Mytilus coruscus TaxID=42192 RepID=A0A6J8EGV1_MYTCO|nr:unnamed protein product [Mytilus coruscus]
MIVGEGIQLARHVCWRRLLKESIADVSSTDGVDIVTRRCKINIKLVDWTIEMVIATYGYENYPKKVPSPAIYRGGNYGLAYYNRYHGFKIRRSIFYYNGIAYTEKDDPYARVILGKIKLSNYQICCLRDDGECPLTSKQMEVMEKFKGKKLSKFPPG